MKGCLVLFYKSELHLVSDQHGVPNVALFQKTNVNLAHDIVRIVTGCSSGERWLESINAIVVKEVVHCGMYTLPGLSLFG